MNTFQLSTLQDLLTAKDDKHRFAVEDLLPLGALSLVGAKAKTGKSTWKRNIELGVARGEPVMGRETVQGRVLSLALEESSSDVAAHYRRMGATGQEDLLVHVGMAPRDPLLALEAAIREYKPSLVTIDPLQRFMRIRDLNNYAEVSAAFEPLGEMARVYDAHIMLIHHIGKGEHLGGLSDAFIGSTAIFGSVDIGLIMLKADERRTIQTDGPQRFGVNVPATMLNFDPDTGLVTVGEVLSVARRQELEQSILDALADMQMPMPDIKKAVGGDSAKTHSAVLALYKDGFLDREGTGKPGDGYRYRVRLAPSEQRANGHDKRAEVNRLASEFIEGRDSNPLWQGLTQ